MPNTPIYPADVQGRFHFLRRWISGSLVIFFLLLPWIEVNGHQAILLDFWRGRFSLFGINFWAHDAPLFFFLFGGAAILLAAITSLWGRIWCGWACPQTVFINSIFLPIERLIEGNAYNRKKLDESPWSSNKFLKKALKWSIFLFISLFISHNFLAYFIGTESLRNMMFQTPAENWGSFLAMAGISILVLFDFAWFREQFCVLLCPYGRFQSVLMDEESLAVVYDKNRGEPRRNSVPPGEKKGDCVDCKRCVQVCPTGIDIRNGLQLECIACTACIDACNAVMDKINKAPNLIRYVREKKSQSYFSKRSIIYFSLLFLMMAGLGVILSKREALELTLVRSVGLPYQEITKNGLEKEIVNYFKLDLQNQGFDPIKVEFSNEEKNIRLISPALPMLLNAGENKRIDFFIQFPLTKLSQGSGSYSLNIFSVNLEKNKSIRKVQELPLVGPLH